MSNEVDKRIVEMQFDNKKFQKNCEDTIDSLEKLNDSLKSTTSTRSLEDLNKSLNSMSIGNIASDIEDLADRFSLLGIMGMTAVENITNRLVDMGIELAKSLTIDQISAGFEKYEQNALNVKTIMNQAGMSIEEVETYMEKLSWFSDVTSYDFSSMGSALQQFISAGIDIEEAIPMIMGIGTSVSYAGKSAKEGSAAFQIYSKAMNQGYMNLRQWQSLQNMGIVSEGLKQQFLDAAVAVGTLKKKSDGTYKTLNGLTVSLNEFDSTLGNQKGKWLTQQVMLEVLGGEYGNVAAAMQEYSAAGGNISVITDETIQDFREATGIIDEFGEAALLASTDARTFTEAVDAVKDAVSTQFKNILEVVFGNVEEATTLWGDLSEALANVFLTPIAGISEVMKAWKDAGGRDLLFGKSVEEDGTITAFGAIYVLAGKVSEALSPIGEAFRSVFPKVTVEQLLEATQTFKDFVDNLEVSKGVSDALRSGLTVLFKVIKMGSTAIKKLLGIAIKVVDLLSPIVNLVFELASVFLDLIDTIITFFDFGNLLEQDSTMIGDIIMGIYNFVEPIITWLIEKFGELSEFISTVFNGLKNVFDPVYQVLKSFVQELLSIIGSIFNLSDITGIFSAALDAVGKFFQGLIDWSKNGGGTIKDFWTVFKKIGTECLAGFWNGISSKFFSLLGKVVDLFASIITAVKHVFGIASPSKKFEEIGEFIAEGFLKGLNKLRESKDKIIAWGKGLINKLKKIFSGEITVIDIRKSIDIEKIKQGFENIGIAVGEAWKVVKEAVKSFFDGLSQSIKDGFTKVKTTIVDTGKDLTKGVSKVLDHDLSESVDASTEKTKKSFLNLKNVLKAALLGDLIGILYSLLRKIRLIFNGPLSIMATIRTGLNNVFDAISKSISNFRRTENTIAMIKSLGTAFVELAIGLIAISMVKPEKLVMGMTAVIVMIASLTTALKALSKMSFGNIITNVEQEFIGKEFLKSSSTQKAGVLKAIGMMIEIASAVFILAMAMKKVSDIENGGAAIVTFGVMIAGIIGIYAAFAIMNKKFKKNVAIPSGMIAMSLSILIMSFTIKQMGDAIAEIQKQGTIDAVITGIITYGVLIAAVYAVITKIEKTTKSSKKSVSNLSSVLSLVSKIILIITALKAITDIAGKNSKAMWNGIGALGVLFVEFGLFLGIMNSLAKNYKPANIKALGTLFMETSVMIVSVALALELLKNINLGQLAISSTILMALFEVLVLIVGQLANKKATNIKAAGKTILEVAAALDILSLAIIALGLVPWTIVAKGAALLGGGIAVLVGTAALMSLFSNGAEKLVKILQALAETAISIGVSFPLAAVGIALLKLVMSDALGVLSMIAGAILTVIIAYAAPLTMAIETLIVAACTAIVGAAGPIFTAMEVVIAAALTALFNLIEENAYDWFFSIGRAFATGIGGLWDGLTGRINKNWLKDRITGETQVWKRDALGVLRNAAGETVEEYEAHKKQLADAQAVHDAKMAALEVDAAVDGYKSEVEAKEGEVTNSGFNLMQFLSNGISGGNGDVGNALNNVFASISGKFEGFDWSGLGNMGGSNLLAGLVNGTGDVKILGLLEGNISDLGPMIEGWLMTSTEEHSPSKMTFRIGSYLIEGLANGLDEKKNSGQFAGLITKVKKLASSVLEKMKSTLGINSPSTETFEVATYVILGFANGITKNSDIATKATETLGDKVLNAINAISKNIEDDAINPVITPVMDLSQIQNGSNQLDGILGSRQLAASVNASYSNPAWTNSYLASEITKIKDQISKMGENSNEEVLVKALNTALNKVGIYMDGNKVGRMVTEYQVNSVIAAGK